MEADAPLADCGGAQRCGHARGLPESGQAGALQGALEPGVGGPGGGAWQRVRPCPCCGAGWVCGLASPAAADGAFLGGVWRTEGFPAAEQLAGAVLDALLAEEAGGPFAGRSRPGSEEEVAHFRESFPEVREVVFDAEAWGRPAEPAEGAAWRWVGRRQPDGTFIWEEPVDVSGLSEAQAAGDRLDGKTALVALFARECPAAWEAEPVPVAAEE